MESQDGSWASLNQSDAQGSSSSMQLSRDSFSTSDSHQVDVDLLGGDLALSDDSSEGESEEVDSDSDSEESEEEQHGDPDQDVEQSDRKTREEVKLDQPFKQGWVRECLMDGKKVQIDTKLKLLQITYSRCVTKGVGPTFYVILLQSLFRFCGSTILALPSVQVKCGGE